MARRHPTRLLAALSTVVLAVTAVVAGTAAPAAAAGFTSVVDFESYPTGSVSGVDGWVASSGAQVVADPEDPTNQVLRMAGSGLKAYRPVPGVQQGDTGTLFFRFRRVGNVDTSVGLTDVNAPTSFTDSRAYANNQNSSVLSVRDGGTFRPVGTWDDATWQCVWLVTDHATRRTAIYGRGGPYATTTRLPVDQELTYAFRTSTTGPLDRFWMINGGWAGGTDLVIDDIAVDPTAATLDIPSGDPADCGGSSPPPPPPCPTPDPPSTTGALQPFALFDDYANGSLRTQGTWQVNQPGAADGALAAADVPAVLSGRAMVNQVSGFDVPVRYRGNAYAALGALAVDECTTATVFWEFLPTDLADTDLSVGLSADPSPGLGADTSGDLLDLDDFGPQVRVDPRGLVLRDGATDRVVDNVTITAGTRYRLWLHADNAADRYEVHVAAPGQAPVRAAAGSRTSFAFRTPSAADLGTLLIVNDPDDPPSADSYLDSLFVAPDTVTTVDPSPAYAEVVDFESYPTGAVSGRDGWSATAAASVAADPADTANQALEMTGSGLKAHRAVPSVQQGDTGTLYFRFRREGTVDTSLGLTDVDAPTSFGDSRVQANNQNSDTLQMRDGGTFAPIGTWSADVWQCVWLVTDHATRRTAVYSRGGPYPVTTRLPVDEELTYAHRATTVGALDRFWMINGSSSAGRLLVDDIAVDPTAANLRVPSGDGDDCEVTDDGTVDLPVGTPVPDTPLDSDITLHLEEVTRVPASATSGADARINVLSEVPGFAGRYAVPDLNGPLHLVIGGTASTYLDADATFPDFVRSPGLGTGLGFVAFHPEYAANGRFYTVHTEAGNALTSKTPTLPSPSGADVHGVVTEWTASNPAATTFSGSRREVLRIGYSTFLHGIQQISFNPLAEPGDADYGLLYIGSGDGDEVPNFSSRPRDLGAPQGKVLRIDPRGTNGPGGRYGIPASNPFVGQAGALGEVYALGFRNPHRFSWDPLDGRMFLGNIGEKSIDAVYDVRAGDNAGWNEREGAFRFDRSDPTNVYRLPPDDAANGYDYPVLQIGRNTGISLVGGFVYRGQHAELRGAYVFGDIVSGQVRYAEASLLDRGTGDQPASYNLDIVGPNGSPTTLRTLVGQSRVDLRFGQDADGELYLLSKATGHIWRVADVTGDDRALDACVAGTEVVSGVSGAGDWDPLTPAKWDFSGGQVILTEQGTTPSGPRRPSEYAVLTTGPAWTSFRLEAEVRIDEPVSVNQRDVVLLWDHTSDTRFHYVHLSQDNTIYAHNGIFVVDDADRLRLDDQWNGSTGAPPAIDDADWHRVRVDHCGATGETAVFVDGADFPLMTSTDTTFTAGRVGFGSFDNYGRVRNLTVTGTT